MTQFDVFNGDADGLCSLHQLRLAEPRDAVLVTGVKRDVALLARVAAEAGDAVTVLDVSVDANRKALTRLLERGVDVQYFDHHYAGDLPVHPRLQAFIDPSPAVCTGIIVDRFLGGRHRLWAIVAAFGDNLAAAAQELAATLALDPVRQASLQELGETLAYNAYGDSESDLIVPPDALYDTLRLYADPLAFAHEEAVLRRIAETRRDDLDRARRVRPERASERRAVYVLPDAEWSRRVRGALGNELAVAYPERAHALLTPNAHQGYTVSVRAPLATSTGADALCRRFKTGGGRAAAAGINHLPDDRLPAFVRQFERAF